MATTPSVATIAAFIRFGLGGVISGAVALSTAALVHEYAGVGERPAGACGFAAALVVNFFVLRLFVFPAANAKSIGRQALTYLSTTGVFRGLEFCAFYAVNKYLDVEYLIAMMLVLGTSFIVKFVVYRIVFGGRPDGASDL